MRLHGEPEQAQQLRVHKAFDSISKYFIIEAFKLFGFGEQFTKWVKTLFSNTFSSINYGGWLSERSVSTAARGKGVHFRHWPLC